MNNFPEPPAEEEPTWGPYQLRHNPIALLRLSLGTGAFISIVQMIPATIALIPSYVDPLSFFCRAVGLWAYCYCIWVVGFLCMIHIVRLISSGIVLDSEGIKVGAIGKKIAWEKIVAVSVVERKLFSRICFIPAYLMSIHFTKPDGKRASKQLASFQYLPQEFFSLYYHISKLGIGVCPNSLDALVFKNISNSDLKKIADESRLKNLAITAVIAFGLVTYMGKVAVRDYTFNMGTKEFRAGNYDKAIGYYSITTAIEFTYSYAWDLLARSEFRQGDIESAESDWKTALRWKPDYVEAKLGLSVIDMIRGDLDEAEKLIASANRLAPYDEAAYLNRARIDMLRGKTRLAIDRLEQFVRQRVGREDAICMLARCYIHEGQLGKARKLLDSDAALLKNPYYRPTCLLVLAELNLAMDNPNEANRLLKSIRRSANSQPEFLIDLANLDIVHKDFDSARRRLDLAAAINPGDPWLCLARARLFDSEGNKSASFEWLSKAINFKYADSGVLASCASVLLEQGKRAEAIQLAHQSLALDSQNLYAAKMLEQEEAKAARHE